MNTQLFLATLCLVAGGVNFVFFDININSTAALFCFWSSGFSFGIWAGLR